MTIHTALIAVAKEIVNPIKTADNPHFRSKFAPLCEILPVVRALLAKHGLVLTQTTDVTEYGPVLVTTIHHEDGTFITGRYPLDPQKKDPQGYAAAVTFARRYALTAMLGIAGDNDDDGEAASKPAKVDAATGETKRAKTKLTDEQTKHLGLLRADLHKLPLERMAEAEIDFNNEYKRLAYSDYQTIHAGLVVTIEKWRAISINDQAANRKIADSNGAKP